MDEQLFAVAQRVPGFGGMFLDAADWLNVYLLDPADLSQAQEAIAAVYGRERISVTSVRALIGQYPILQLAKWQAALTELWGRPGVVMTAVDGRRNRLVIGVTDASQHQAVERALRRGGIPPEAVIIEEMPPPVPLPE